jgi:hypothetical protein
VLCGAIAVALAAASVPAGGAGADRGVAEAATEQVVQRIEAAGKDLAMSETIHLSFMGDAGATFQAECRLDKGGEQMSWNFSGSVPYSTEIDASGIRCSITSKDRLTVEARGGRGNVTRTSTSGGTVTISLNAR